MADAEHELIERVANKILQLVSAVLSCPKSLILHLTLCARPTKLTEKDLHARVGAQNVRTLQKKCRLRALPRWEWSRRECRCAAPFARPWSRGGTETPQGRRGSRALAVPASFCGGRHPRTRVQRIPPCTSQASFWERKSKIVGSKPPSPPLRAPPPCIAGQSGNIDIGAGFRGGSGKSMGILYKSATKLEPVKTFFVCILALTRTPVVDCFWSFFDKSNGIAPCRMTVFRVLSVR